MDKPDLSPAALRALVEVGRKLEQAATPGPWTVRADHEERDHAHVDGPDGKEVCRIEGEREDYDGSLAAAEDAERRLDAIPAFIADARTRLPLALDAVAVLLDENERLRDAVEAMAHYEERQATQRAEARDRGREADAVLVAGAYASCHEEVAHTLRAILAGAMTATDFDTAALARARGTENP